MNNNNSKYIFLLVILLTFFLVIKCGYYFSNNNFIKKCHDDDYYKSENTMIETYIDDSTPKPIFILNDGEGNISTFDPMTTNLNSDWKIKGKLCIENVCVNENDIKSPVGIIIPFAGKIVPPSYLICDGRTLLKTDYTELFEVLGNTYGSVTTTSFNIPDLRGRTIIGTGGGTNLTNRLVGATGGTESETLTIAQMPSHTHTGNTSFAGSHKHSLDIMTDKGAGNESPHLSTTSDANTDYYHLDTNPVGNHTHDSLSILSVGGGESHNNMHPFIVLNYIIKAK